MQPISRRVAMSLAGVAVLMPSEALSSPSPDWTVEAPDAAGFPADLRERLEAGISSGLLKNLHSVLAARDGKLFLEYYGSGEDERWGRPLGSVSFGPDTLHDLRSATKSVVGLLYGIALDRGLVPPPEAPLLAQFPAYPDLAADPQRARLTVLHALTMTMGLAWDEQRSYRDPVNSEIAMEAAPDRYRFILDRPVVTEPGRTWTYSGGAVALLGALIARGSGKTLQAFAKEALFSPLGIGTFEWIEGRDGVASAASGLRLRPRDLLRIGQLILDGGRWNGQPIVSRAWLDASFAPAVPATSIGDGVSYGRLWYLGRAATHALKGARPWIAAFGNGGQRLWLMPDAGLACVSFSGAYDVPDQWITPLRVWREIVLANFQRA